MTSTTWSGATSRCTPATAWACFAGLLSLRVDSQGGCPSYQGCGRLVPIAHRCRRHMFLPVAKVSPPCRMVSLSPMEASDEGPARSLNPGRRRWVAVSSEGMQEATGPVRAKLPKPGRPPYRASLTSGTSLPPRGNAVPNARWRPCKLALFVAGLSRPLTRPVSWRTYSTGSIER